jgi:hypothetical protein
MAHLHENLFVGCKVDDTEVGVKKYIKGHLLNAYKRRVEL